MEHFLPTHESMLSDDPLGICDENEPVNQGKVLDIILESSKPHAKSTKTFQLVEVIDQILYSIHGIGDADLSNLRYSINCMQQHGDSNYTIYERAARNIVTNAQQLLRTFPGATLSILTENCNKVTYTGEQINVLLSHQLLGSVSQPPGNTWGLPNFTCWYSTRGVYDEICQSYIETLLRHFSSGGYSADEWKVSFTLSFATDMLSPLNCQIPHNVKFIIIPGEADPSSHDISCQNVPFVLVPANCQPGAGRSATHEERLMATSPALNIAALICPSLPEDAALVTSAIPVNARWVGHGRSARLVQHIPPEKQPKRRYILADALPLDEMDIKEHDGLKDLAESVIEREIRKLYAAFSGAAKVAKDSGDEECHIEAGAWGCGAFGGNLVVKTVCMVIAAAMADVALTVRVLEDKRNDVKVLRRILKEAKTAAKLWILATSGTLRYFLHL